MSDKQKRTEYELKVYKGLKSDIVKSHFVFTYPAYAEKNYNEYFV